MLSKEEMLAGHTPTNATTSSIIAGVEVQEAIKHLAGKSEMSALKDKIWRFMGDQMDTFTSIVSVDEDCIYHFDPIKTCEEIELPDSLNELFVRYDISRDGYIGFFNDFLHVSPCLDCGGEPIIGFRDLMKGLGVCKKCGKERDVTTANRIVRGDFAAEIHINHTYWPISALVQIIDHEVRTLAIKGDKNE